VPRWVRTLPVKFRVEPAPATPPTLTLVPLAGCDDRAPASAGPERAVAVRAAGRSGDWIGHADLRDLGGGCARLEVRVGGVVAGSARVVLRQ